MIQPHPMRCETCADYRLNGCIALAKDTSLIRIVGCASWVQKQDEWDKINSSFIGIRETPKFKDPGLKKLLDQDTKFLKKKIYNDILKNIIKYLDGGENDELDCNTTDAWYGYGWTDCRDNLIQCLKSLPEEKWMS